MSNTTRLPLTRERVLQAAVALVDRDGLGSLTMRRLGAELGVEAMSIYKHVANKDEILDGMVELVVGETELPEPGSDWQEAMRLRATSAREVFGRHPWALGLLEARSSVGPTVLRYIEAVIGSLRQSGFSIEMAAHAFWLLDAYVYGQVIQEISLPFGSEAEMTESIGAVLEQIPLEEYPYLAEMGGHALGGNYSFDNEFEFGLELILDALEALRTAEG